MNAVWALVDHTHRDERGPESASVVSTSLVFLVGFVVSAYLAKVRRGRLIAEVIPASSTGLATAPESDCGSSAAGLFFFAVRALQINPLLSARQSG